jgi:hypothetical protein
MGNLRPIGSEKLQGMDKINRMIEIARYNENIPQPVNEDKSNEFKKVLSDGNTYNIVKEKNGYVIKKGINESVHEYLEPMKNRKYYSSYSQALKRLNLITKEVNVSEGYTKNLSLFNENEIEEKIYLKMPTDEQAAPAPAPLPAPAPETAPLPAPAPAPTPSPEDEMGVEDEMGMEDEMGDEEGQDDEPVTLKTIQKLTGKLAQKLRAFSSIEEDGMTSNDTKYVINSILSALDLDSLEEDDKEEIMSKFEGESEEGMGDEGMGEEGMSDEGMETEPPVSPEGEMAEDFMGDEEIENPEEFVKDIFNMDEEESMDDMGDKYPRHGMRKRKSREDHRMSDDHAIHMEEMIEGMFTESKVDNILKKYFKIDEREKVLSEEKKKKQLIESDNNKKTVQRIKSLSESVSQEISSTKIIKKYPKAKLLGKNKNSNLVFEYNNKKLRVTPKGSIL